MPTIPRADGDFQAAKGGAYSEIADLIDEYGYPATMAACAEFVSRRANDEMRDKHREEWEPPGDRDG